ncbi:YwpF family protein [Lysinibacillus pakistanensis]|uniref:YwpF family protein n=1 Tax=Lysinibacillus pakistanensis TaxID=759811 RepID=UPI003D287989
MKTFKMLSFDLVTKDGIQTFPLVDGIIINQENSHQSWILELFMERQYCSTFQHLLEKAAVFNVRAVISFPDNEPAPFQVAVHTIQEIGEHISVLLKGKLKTKRSKYAEQLLAELLAEGVSLDNLLDRFSHDMKERPKLKND